MCYHFTYYSTKTLLNFVGKQVYYLDLSNKIQKSILESNGSRVWLKDAACCPFADTCKIYLPNTSC